MLTYVSLGAGVQSSALLVMSALGLRGCPKADVAVFADTQAEPRWVYEQVVALKAWAEPLGMPVWRVTRGALVADKVIRVPAFVLRRDAGHPTKKRPGPLSQNCTRDYKITPINRAVRAYMRDRGLKTATILKGISTDEADREKPSQLRWLTARYPLLEARMNRRDCEDLLRAHGLPVPRKSACVFCPWRSAKNWMDVRDYDPEGWALAVAYDDRVWHQKRARLHRSMIPLREVAFKAQQNLDLDGFSNECEGFCGV